MYGRLVGVTQAFDDIDKDGTGAIPNTKETLLEGAQLSGLNPTDQELERHMETGRMITASCSIEPRHEKTCLCYT